MTMSAISGAHPLLTAANDNRPAPQPANARPEAQDETHAPPPPPPAPRLVIERDEASQRFVQTLIDPANDSVVRRYPHEAELAFARGVNAYLHALARRL